MSEINGKSWVETIFSKFIFGVSAVPVCKTFCSVSGSIILKQIPRKLEYPLFFCFSKRCPPIVIAKKSHDTRDMFMPRRANKTHFLRLNNLRRRVCMCNVTYASARQKGTTVNPDGVMRELEAFNSVLCQSKAHTAWCMCYTWNTETVQLMLAELEPREQPRKFWT